MLTPSRRPAALIAAALLVIAVLGLACSGGSKSSSSADKTPVATVVEGEAAGGASELTTEVQAAAVTGTVGGEAKAAIQALGVGAPGLGAWTIEVSFDPAIVSATACEGTESSACNTQLDDHTIRLAGASAVGLQGDVTLMTLTFQCNAAGTSPLDVNIVLLADATIGNPLAIDAPAQDGSVTCS